MTFAVGPVDKGIEALLGPECEIASQYEGLRLRQFCSGRNLARTLLASLGGPQCPIGRAPSGAPLWPEGYTGSISHSADQVAAIVARSSDYWAVGLDIERVGAIAQDIWQLLFTEAECEFLAKHDTLTTAFFAIKEAFMKLPSPRPELFQDYRDIEVRYRGNRFTLHGANTDLRRHTGCPFLTATVRPYSNFVVATIAIES